MLTNHTTKRDQPARTAVAASVLTATLDTGRSGRQQAQGALRAHQNQILEKSVCQHQGLNDSKSMVKATSQIAIHDHLESIARNTQQRLLVNMKQALVQIGIVLIGVPHDVGAVGFVIGDDVVLNGVKVTLRVRSTIEQKP